MPRCSRCDLGRPRHAPFYAAIMIALVDVVLLTVVAA
jgi:hypothetical protein